MELIIVVILSVTELSSHFKLQLWPGGERNCLVNEKVTGPIPTTVYVCITAEEDI